MKLYQSSKVQTNQLSVSKFNFLGIKECANIFTPVNQLSICNSQPFWNNKQQQNWIFLYQWTFYDLNLICLVQKPAWNCHITSFVSIQQRPSFNIFVLFHTFDTTMEENAQTVYSLLKSRTWILTSSVALQFYFESSLIKDCIIHLILWLSFYDFIINTLTYPLVNISLNSASQLPFWKKEICHWSLN